jgi:hypothetical protein
MQIQYDSQANMFLIESSLKEVSSINVIHKASKSHDLVGFLPHLGHVTMSKKLILTFGLMTTI